MAVARTVLVTAMLCLTGGPARAGGAVAAAPAMAALEVAPVNGDVLRYASRWPDRNKPPLLIEFWRVADGARWHVASGTSERAGVLPLERYAQLRGAVLAALADDKLMPTGDLACLYDGPAAHISVGSADGRSPVSRPLDCDAHGLEAARLLVAEAERLSGHPLRR